MKDQEIFSYKLDSKLLFLMTATTGLVIANNYYNQPLLGLMAAGFGVTELQISNVPMLTQIGFALGLFIIVPLGDKMERKKLILSQFFFMICALLATGWAQSPLQLKIASFFVGFTSVVPQLIIPMAAQLADNKNRGAVIGAVMTGLFIGILGSRTLSGFIGIYLGWQAMFFLAAGMMSILFIFLNKSLPQIQPDFTGNYISLLKSILQKFRSQPKLRLASFRGALDFAGFSIFWTTLVFLLESPPFYFGSDIAGAMGLVGIAGAIVASWVGKLSDKMNKNRLISIGILIILLSWAVIGFSTASIVGLIIGAFLLDWGVQSVHITNQTIIFEGNPADRNQINTVYMVMYFIGGALGTMLGGYLWFYYGWHGVSYGGGIITVIMFLVHIVGNRRIKSM
ncbi:MFS transporter [Sphingobacterium sp. UT-1RO-CII-1]|uniref:MFS transporter n=1 Tax=Sphingobacterium sp. UT-1RO-CII-1 TaxID=2995225 RepID=UPI00227B13A5|nr:MFS transporter [Sphingobacterium sp. UT-1RO-CII-1]MCY4780614.1 MFS transporter [Sphingobacterium sp. UT-1RO-CII-1]